MKFSISKLFLLLASLALVATGCEKSSQKPGESSDKPTLVKGQRYPAVISRNQKFSSVMLDSGDIYISQSSKFFPDAMHVIVPASKLRKMPAEIYSLRDPDKKPDYAGEKYSQNWVYRIDSSEELGDWCIVSSFAPRGLTNFIAWNPKTGALYTQCGKDYSIMPNIPGVFFVTIRPAKPSKDPYENPFGTTFIAINGCESCMFSDENYRFGTAAPGKIELAGISDFNTKTGADFNHIGELVAKSGKKYQVFTLNFAFQCATAHQNRRGGSYFIFLRNGKVIFAPRLSGGISDCKIIDNKIYTFDWDYDEKSSRRINIRKRKIDYWGQKGTLEEILDKHEKAEKAKLAK